MVVVVVVVLVVRGGGLYTEGNAGRWRRGEGVPGVEHGEVVVVRGHGGVRWVQERLPHLETDLEDDGHCLLSLALHETPGTATHHREQYLEELATLPYLPHVQEPRARALEYLVVLEGSGGEVNEETAAHVRLEMLDLGLVCRLEPVDEEGTVLEEATSTNFLRVPGVYESLVQVPHCLLVVRVHGHGVDSREKLGRSRDRALSRALSEREIVVEENLERIDGELKLTPDLVDKFELDAPGGVFVAEGEEGPGQLVRHYEDHLPDVRLLEEVTADATLGRFLREELEQRHEHLFLYHVEGAVVSGVGYGEDKIDVVEFHLGKVVRVCLT